MDERPGGGVAGGGEATGEDGVLDELAVVIGGGGAAGGLLELVHSQVVDLTCAFPLQLGAHGRGGEEFSQTFAEPHGPDAETLLDADVVQDLVDAFVGDGGNRLTEGEVRANLGESRLLIDKNAI